MNITIILTSTVNVQIKTALFQKSKEDRINSYIKPIKKWLFNTNFHIILVENTGYTFPELKEEEEFYKNRFEIISFKENQVKEAKYLLKEEGKGGSEIFAINYAYNNSILIKNSIFIIKVTARYFIPGLEKYLNRIDLHFFDALHQNDTTRCEMVGSHINNFHIIFNKYLIDDNGNYNQHVESIYELRMKWFEKVIRCQIFDIEPTQRGGVPEIFKNI
jgi:hypothetical protein